MLKTINYTLLLVAAALTLNSCDSGTKTETAKDTAIVATPTTEAKPEAAPMALTKLEFLESSYDFGKIDEGKKVEHIFKFKNTGENPLVLQDARASCGCTIPENTTDTNARGSEG